MSPDESNEVQKAIKQLQRLNAEVEGPDHQHTQRLVKAYHRLAEEMTEHQRSEQARQHLAAIVDSANDAIFSKDLNGMVQSWNPGAERLFGHRAHEIIGKSVTVLLPTGRVKEETVILKKLKGEGRVEHFEALRQHQDGRLISVSLTISPVKNGEGKIIGESQIARDISERKQIEAQAAVIAQLKHALAEIKTLRGMIPICSHCKKIREDANSWLQMEKYILQHTDAQFTHGICPECMDKHYADYATKRVDKTGKEV